MRTHIPAWRLAPASACFAVLLAGCGPVPEPPPTFHPSTPAEAAALLHYTSAVRPVLRENCYRCHTGMNHKGGFGMETREQLLKGGDDGAVVVPGDPAHSLLVTLIRHEGKKEHPGPMPPKGKLSDAEIAAVTQWIANGAIMDR